MTRYERLRKVFLENSNSKEAIDMKKYMRNQFEFFGINATLRKELEKEFIKEAKEEKKVDFDFLDKCYDDCHREMHYFVLDYLKAMNKFLTYDDIDKLICYVEKNQWWDSIDHLDNIIGRVGLEDSRIDTLMLKWAKDKDFWKRRLAIDHQNGRKEKTNEELLEKIIVMNFGSDEFFINKAIGWSLREYAKVNPIWVRNFLDNYQSKMASLSIREALKNIDRKK